MAQAAAEKFSSIMSKALLAKLRKHAEQNGQSTRFVLENAVKHYLEVVVPSAAFVRPGFDEMLKAAVTRHDGLLKRLAKAK